MTKPFLSIGLFGIAVASTGCDDPRPAELLVPEEIDVHETELADEPDLRHGALVPVDVMAYDSATGEPLAGLEVTVWTEADTAWPVPVEAVVFVDPDDCIDCEPWWDSERDEFVEALPYQPELTTFSDEDGLVRLYMFVDEFPQRDGTSDELAVFVSMGTLEESFVLTPRR